MNEMNVEKLKHRCHSIGMLVRGAFWFYVFGCFVIFCIMIGLCTLSPDSFALNTLSSNPETVTSLSFLKADIPIYSDLGLNVTGIQNAKYVVLIMFGVWVLLLIATAYSFWMLRQIFINVSEGDSPFTKRNCRLISKIGWITLMLGVFGKMLIPAAYAVTGFGKFTISFDITSIVFGSIIIALSYIFEYGTALQQESDELL